MHPNFIFFIFFKQIVENILKYSSKVLVIIKILSMESFWKHKLKFSY
jgi:hypothetical protein